MRKNYTKKKGEVFCNPGKLSATSEEMQAYQKLVDEVKQFENPEVQQDAVIKVGKILGDEEANPPIDAFLKLGIAPLLIQCLDSKNSVIQQEAIWALITLTSGNYDQTSEVVKAGVIPHFIKLLESDDPKKFEQALWGLENISIEYSFPEYLLQNGISQVLASKLTDSKHKITLANLKDISRIMENLGEARNYIWRDYEVLRSQIFTIILHLLQCEDPEVLRKAMLCVVKLTDEIEMIESFIQNNVIVPIFALLNHSDAKVVTYAIDAGINLSAGDEKQTLYIFECRILDHMQRLLSQSNQKIRFKAIRLLSNLVADSEKSLQKVIDAEFLPTIVDTSKESDVEIQRECSFVICNALMSANETQLKYLLTLDIISAMCNFIESSNREILENVLFNFPAIAEKIKKENKEMCQCFYDSLQKVKPESYNIRKIEDMVQSSFQALNAP